MAWRGPSGLIGAPAAERAGEYEVYSIENHPGCEVFVHRDVLAVYRQPPPPRLGDHLFHVEGMGRVRIRLL